ncbi:GNAT family N-acetyltransferase [Metapseudomonas furukawaii]|jgi:RimJ/RimL family protein N-acetyltransferase|uniref:GNAT family N-acetyltransferase n=1 Tax=Metapseudomonas furukawaii TaxID=1149133 RepID=UPI000B49800E|nr:MULTISPECIES: GNAT family N-acetyltransferase [Pseudomonas]OWJ91334.1 GNAT family N-acetyltransferase [Pseudomonas sp. A46]WAG79869.1 GNAT family N-acetyltransferase [Pseudomonas furukawaii]
MPCLDLETPRLRLRTWRDDDLAAFAALNADPEVMRHFPGCLGRDESDALAARIRQHIEDHGFGQWVVEDRADGAFVGVLGLQNVNFDAPFTPAVEIGWRFLPRYWGQGLACEAARAALAFAFERLPLAEVVAFTVPANLPSQALMERLGMQRDGDGDFEHPRLPEGHALRPHRLYRLGRAQWEALQ